LEQYKNYDSPNLQTERIDAFRRISKFRRAASSLSNEALLFLKSMFCSRSTFINSHHWHPTFFCVTAKITPAKFCADIYRVGECQHKVGSLKIRSKLLGDQQQGRKTRASMNPGYDRVAQLEQAQEKMRCRLWRLAQGAPLPPWVCEEASALLCLRFLVRSPTRAFFWDEAAELVRVEWGPNRCRDWISRLHASMERQLLTADPASREARYAQRYSHAVLKCRRQCEALQQDAARLWQHVQPPRLLFDSQEPMHPLCFSLLHPTQVFSAQEVLPRLKPDAEGMCLVALRVIVDGSLQVFFPPGFLSQRLVQRVEDLHSQRFVTVPTTVEASLQHELAAWVINAGRFLPQSPTTLPPGCGLVWFETQ
jgi:hypothetical protein